jgi:hypothetical protein
MTFSKRKKNKSLKKLQKQSVRSNTSVIKLLKCNQTNGNQ